MPSVAFCYMRECINIQEGNLCKISGYRPVLKKVKKNFYKTP